MGKSEKRKGWLLRAAEYSVRSGCTNWNELLRWFAVFCLGLVLNSIPVWFGWECLGLILFAVMMLSPPDFSVGATLQTLAFNGIGVLVYPVVTAIGLAAGLVSLQLQLVVTVIVLAPFIDLSYDSQLRGWPKLVVGFGGFSILSGTGSTGPEIVAILASQYRTSLTVLASLMLLTAAIQPSMAVVKARALLSYALMETAEGLAKDMGWLFKTGKTDLSTEKITENSVQDEVTAQEWDQPPRVTPFGLHNNPNINELRQAERMLSFAKWEPNIWHPRCRMNMDAWKAVTNAVEALLIARAALQSALAYEEVRECSDAGTRLIFNNDRSRALWQEMIASMAVLTKLLSEWLVCYDDLDDFPETGNLDETITEISAGLTELVPTLITAQWQSGKATRASPKTIRSMVFVAVTLIYVANATVRLEDAMRDLAENHCNGSWKNVLWTYFGWLALAVSTTASRLKADIPDLRTIPAIVKFFRSYRFMFFLRFLIMVVLIMWIDIFFLPGVVTHGNSAWILISAVLVHNTSVESTFLAALLRPVGTLFGALLGASVMASPVFATTPVLITAYLCGIGTLGLLMFEVIPWLKPMGYVRLLTFLTLFLVVSCQFKPNCTANCTGTMEFAVTRMVAVIAGSAVSVLCQLLVFPRFAQGEARRNMADLMNKQYKAFRCLLTRYDANVRDRERSYATSFSVHKTGSTGTELNTQLFPQSSTLNAMSSIVNPGTATALDTQLPRSSTANTLPSIVNPGTVTAVGTLLPRSSTLNTLSSIDRDTVIVMTTEYTPDLREELASLREELSVIEQLLAQTPVVTNKNIIRRLTLGAPTVLHKMLRLLKSVHVSLVSMSILLRSSEMLQDQSMADDFWEPLSEHFESVLDCLGLMVRICGQAVYRKTPTEMEAENMRDGAKMLASARLQLRRTFVSQSVRLRKAVSDRLRKLQEDDPSHIDGKREVGFDFILFNCIFFIFTAILDSFSEMTTEYRAYSKTQIKWQNKWSAAD